MKLENIKGKRWIVQDKLRDIHDYIFAQVNILILTCMNDEGNKPKSCALHKINKFQIKLIIIKLINFKCFKY